MRLWPWGRAERRDSYTGIVVSALVEAAEGKARDAGKTAALEACAGLYAGAFAAARMDPEIPGIGPDILGEIGRRMIRTGDAVFAIGLDSRARPELHQASAWTITGGPWESSWRYRVELSGPTGTISRTIPSEGVVHLRYSTDPQQPHIGVGPLQRAAASGRLAGGLESLIADEVGATSARVIPIPADGGDGEEEDPNAALKADLAAGRGRALLVETTAGGWEKGMGAAPRSDWQQNRIGPEPPDILRPLRTDAGLAVAAACGVPASLVTDADGTSQREAWRRFVMGAVEPLARRVMAEVGRKLEVSARLDFGPLWASDLVGRATAFQKLVAGGMALEKAAEASGVLAGT